MTSPDVETLLTQAGVADDAGDFGRAAALLEQAAALSPGASKIWAWLGDCYAQDEQYAAAEHAFRAAIRLDSIRAGAHSGLARVLQETSRHTEAAREFNWSIRLQPSAARFVLLAQSLRALGAERDAEDALRRALVLDPDNDEALVSLAQVVRSDRSAEALALLQRASRSSPADSTVLREYGFALAQSGAFQEAQAALSASIALAPSDEWTHLYLSMAFESTDDLQLAEQHLLRAVAAAPLSCTMLFQLGAFYGRHGRVTESETALLRAIETDPTDEEPAVALGALFEGTGRSAQALEWLEKALSINPMHQEAIRVRQRLLDKASDSS